MWPQAKFCEHVYFPSQFQYDRQSVFVKKNAVIRKFSPEATGASLWAMTTIRDAKRTFSIGTFRKFNFCCRQKFLKWYTMVFENRHLLTFGQICTMAEISTGNKLCAFGNFSLWPPFCTNSHLIGIQTRARSTFAPKNAILAQIRSFSRFCEKTSNICQIWPFSVTSTTSHRLRRGPW